MKNDKPKKLKFHIFTEDQLKADLLLTEDYTIGPLAKPFSSVKLHGYQCTLDHEGNPRCSAFSVDKSLIQSLSFGADPSNGDLVKEYENKYKWLKEMAAVLVKGGVPPIDIIVNAVLYANILLSPYPPFPADKISSIVLYMKQIKNEQI